MDIHQWIILMIVVKINDKKIKIGKLVKCLILFHYQLMNYVEGFIFALQSIHLRNVLNMYIKTKLGNHFICFNEFIHNQFSICSMNQIT